jgi:protoheme IX farnesyltransferase
MAKKNSGSKKYSALDKVLGFIELGRPIEWSKPLLNMLLAMLIAFYVYQVPVSLGVLFVGFFSVAFLWSGLYALNDYTDWKIDLIHSVKKNRPIPSGKVSPKQGLIFSIGLVLASFSIAFLLNNIFLGICLFAMLINQLLYTMKPFRLKSVKGLDLVSGSMVNPFFRYFSGLALFVPISILTSQALPILPIIFVVGIQFSGYSLYRLFSKKHDLATKMKSSVALMSEKTIKLLSYSAIVLAVGSYFMLFVNFYSKADGRNINS